MQLQTYINMSELDVFGIGNPLIDLLVNVSDDFIKSNNLEKNRMYLMDLEAQERILSQLNKSDVVYAPGGSCANTMIGISQLGGKAAYCGRVGDDEHYKVYQEKLEEVHVESHVKSEKGTTGSCVVLVTEDASRTMNTHLGMSQKFEAEDVVEERLKVSQYLYIEGYLWDTDSQKAAIMDSIGKAKKHGVKVSLSLSDPFCVQRNGDDFNNLIKDCVDLLFCNQEEAFGLTNSQVSQTALKCLGEHTEMVALTMGANGALLSHQGEITYIDPIAAELKDTTGAGDAFAAGFLYGMTQGKSVLESGQIASMLASLVISEMGPRYQGDVKAKLQELLG